MAVDWESVLAGLVPVVVGIAIGFLLTPLANRWSNRSKRKMLAAVLSPEVETIRAMAAESIKAHEPNVQKVKQSLKTGDPSKRLEFLAADDVDYMTRVYDTHLPGVDLFDEDLAVLLTGLYRFTSMAHHWKARHLAYHQEFMGLTRAIMMG